MDPLQYDRFYKDYVYVGEQYAIAEKFLNIINQPTHESKENQESQDDAGRNRSVIGRNSSPARERQSLALLKDSNNTSLFSPSYQQPPLIPSAPQSAHADRSKICHGLIDDPTERT
jgi:hypothetical protein